MLFSSELILQWSMLKIILNLVLQKFLMWSKQLVFYFIKTVLNISSLLSGVNFLITDRGHSEIYLPELSNILTLFVFCLFLSHFRINSYSLSFSEDSGFCFFLSFWFSYHPFFSWYGFRVLALRSVFILMHHSSLILILSSLIFFIFWCNMALHFSTTHLIYL